MTKNTQDDDDSNDIRHDTRGQPIDAGTVTRNECQIRQKAATVDRDSWLNTRLLKILGIVYGIATPFIVWVVVTSYNQDSKLAILEVKLANLDDKLIAINKVYAKLDEMSESITKIQIDMATLKAKANVP